jgi:hypothetical protein
LMLGVGALILLYMLDDFRALFWRNIASDALEDYPE